MAHLPEAGCSEGLPIRGVAGMRPPSPLCSHWWRPLPLERTRPSCRTPHPSRSLLRARPWGGRITPGAWFPTSSLYTQWALWEQQRERCRGPNLSPAGHHTTREWRREEAEPLPHLATAAEGGGPGAPATQSASSPPPAGVRPWKTQRTPLLLQGAFPDHQVTRGPLYLSLCMELIGVRHNFLTLQLGVPLGLGWGTGPCSLLGPSTRLWGLPDGCTPGPWLGSGGRGGVWLLQGHSTTGQL